jgi:hypothetical protein
MRLRTVITIVITIAGVAIAPAHSVLSGQRLPKKEREIQDRRHAQNGIVVSEPKLYDDALLQQMLSAAQARLSALQLLDQAKIGEKVGTVTGAEQQYNNFAMSLQTPSLPQVKETSKGATSQTVQKEGSAVNTENKPSSQSSTDVTSNQPATDVETTRSAFAPPSAAAAQPSISLPSQFSVSASDVFNEQMQLTFEIANLRLLLDGAISDRMFAIRDKIHRVKPRRTIGVPIAIDPDRRYKNAVAVVEVEIENIEGEAIAKGVKPSVTALLPQEKTYNVAAIRESSTSIGGGVVTQVVGVGGNWLRGRKTYYIVKDQDTLAQMFEPEANDKRVGVSWQFRPVLGQEFVRPRQIHTFVQVALPTTEAATAEYARLHIRTYWRRYDRKSGTIKEIIPGSMSHETPDWNVPTFRPTIPLGGFNHTNLEDLGDGLMLVNVPVPMLPGTSLRIGSTIIRDGLRGALFSTEGLTFVASLSDLATKRFRLIGRNGQETPLVIDREVFAGNSAAAEGEPSAVTAEERTRQQKYVKELLEERKTGSQKDDAVVRRAAAAAPSSSPPSQDELHVDPPPVITSAVAEPVDDSTSRLTVELKAPSPVKKPPQVLVIGGKVFGYSDAPIERNGKTLSATVLTALLREHPRVEVTAVLASKEYRDSKEIGGGWIRGGEKLVPFDSVDGKKIFLLYGSELEDASITVPAGANLEVFSVVGKDGKPVNVNPGKLAKVTIDEKSLEGREQIVLQRRGTRPVLVALPPSTPPKKPAPVARERVVVNADAAVFDSDGLTIKPVVSFNGKALIAEVAKDKKSVAVTGLAAAGATARATTITLDFAFGETKVTAQLEVISARVETVTRPK